MILEKILVKMKIILAISAMIIFASTLVAIRQSGRETSDVLFDHISGNGISQFQPNFTQIKRITLRQSQSDSLQLSIHLAAPLRLKPQDRMLIRVSMLTTRHYGTLTPEGSKGIAFVFPIGYTYASRPPLQSGSAGVVIYSRVGQNLLARTSSSFGKATLVATFNKNLLADPNMAWASRFTDADVLYIPGSAGGQKAYKKGITMGSSNSYAGTVYLGEGSPPMRVVPEHPGSSWEDEKPTMLPTVVRAKS